MFKAADIFGNDTSKSYWGKNLSMSKERKQKVTFTAEKKVSKPVKVEFYTKKGEKVSFKGHEQVKKPVKVEFYAKKTK